MLHNEGAEKGEKGWKGRFGWEQVAPTTSRGRIVGSAHAPCFHTPEQSRAEQSKAELSRCRAREDTVGENGTFLETPLNLALLLSSFTFTKPTIHGIIFSLESWFSLFCRTDCGKGSIEHL